MRPVFQEGSGPGVDPPWGGAGRSWLSGVCVGIRNPRCVAGRLHSSGYPRAESPCWSPWAAIADFYRSGAVNRRNVFSPGSGGAAPERGAAGLVSGEPVFLRAGGRLGPCGLGPAFRTRALLLSLPLRVRTPVLLGEGPSYGLIYPSSPPSGQCLQCSHIEG